MSTRTPWLAIATLAFGIATTLAAVGFTPAAQAQEAWPARPVKIVSPFPAGGTSDIMARMVAEALAKEFNQQFIVENIGGAGGTIGTLRAKNMPADGYTLIQTGVGQNAVAHGLDPKLGYDSLRDFVHLAQVHSGPNVLLVHAGTPWKSYREFADFARTNPGKLSYGYTHAASGHMAMELFKIEASKCPATTKPQDCKGIFMVGIPYRGGAPLLQDLLGGQIQVAFLNQDTALPHVKSGKLRALAVSSLSRNPLYADVPTLAESGLPGFEALSWSGMSVFKGTPQPIVDRLEAALRKVMTSPEVKQRLEATGFVVPPPGAAAYTQFVGKEIELWSRVIKTAGIKAE